MNPPDGEAMYTCLTSWGAFLPNMLAPPELEVDSFGFKCFWLNKEEPDCGLKLENCYLYAKLQVLVLGCILCLVRRT